MYLMSVSKNTISLLAVEDGGMWPRREGRWVKDWWVYCKKVLYLIKSRTNVKIILSSSENTALASSSRSVISFVSQREYKLKLILIGSYRALKCHWVFNISFLC